MATEKPNKTVKKENALKTYNRTAFITGITIAIAFLLIAVLVKCPGQTGLLYYLAKVLIPIAAGLIGSLIPGKATFAGLGVKASGALVLVFVVFQLDPVPVILKDDPKCISQDPIIETRTATVFVDSIPTDSVTVFISELKGMNKYSDRNGNILYEINTRDVPHELTFTFEYIPSDKTKGFNTATLIRKDALSKDMKFYLSTYTKPIKEKEIVYKQVSGTVLDNNYDPLAGVTVSINGKSTTTGSTGYFSLAVENTSGYALIYAKLGNKYDSQNIKVPNNNVKLILTD